MNAISDRLVSLTSAQLYRAIEEPFFTAHPSLDHRRGRRLIQAMVRNYAQEAITGPRPILTAPISLISSAQAKTLHDLCESAMARMLSALTAHAGRAAAAWSDVFEAEKRLHGAVGI